MPTPQQHVLFAGSYATAAQPGIQALTFDEASGTLTPVAGFPGVVNPTFLLVHPNGRSLYAVSETSGADGGPGAVWAFRVVQKSMSELALEPLNHRPSRGDSPCHLQLDATGRWLVVSNYTSGSVGVFPVQDDGALGEMTDWNQHEGSSVHAGRQDGPHAHSATWTPDNRFVIVADLGTDQLWVYRFDHDAGKLGTAMRVATRPGSGPRHLAFHPNGQYVYVAHELDSTVSLVSYEGATGDLKELQHVDALPAPNPESLAADIHITTGGERLYVSNRGHNSLAVFDVGADGRLARVAIPSCGGNWPRNFALTPGGGYVLVANQYSGDLAVLPLVAGAEGVGAASAHLPFPHASCIQFVPGHE